MSAICSDLFILFMHINSDNRLSAINNYVLNNCCDEITIILCVSDLHTKPYQKHDIQTEGILVQASILPDYLNAPLVPENNKNKENNTEFYHVVIYFVSNHAHAQQK